MARTPEELNAAQERKYQPEADCLEKLIDAAMDLNYKGDGTFEFLVEGGAHATVIEILKRKYARWDITYTYNYSANYKLTFKQRPPEPAKQPFKWPPDAPLPWKDYFPTITYWGGPQQGNGNG
jgi:hypothetical protein